MFDLELSDQSFLTLPGQASGGLSGWNLERTERTLRIIYGGVWLCTSIYSTVPMRGAWKGGGLHELMPLLALFRSFADRIGLILSRTASFPFFFFSSLILWQGLETT